MQNYQIKVLKLYISGWSQVILAFGLLWHGRGIAAAVVMVVALVSFILSYIEENN